MNQKQYQPKQDITIGNGIGIHRFSTQKSYTEKALRAVALTSRQVQMYFTTNKR